MLLSVKIEDCPQFVRGSNSGGSKGVLNLSNKLFNFSKHWGFRASKAEFHKFLLVTLKNSEIPTAFIVKHAKFFEIILKTMIWGNWYVNVADEKWPRFVRDFNSGLKLLTFQLSHVRELATLTYVNAAILQRIEHHLESMMTHTAARYGSSNVCGSGDQHTIYQHQHHHPQDRSVPLDLHIHTTTSSSTPAAGIDNSNVDFPNEKRQRVGDENTESNTTAAESCHESSGDGELSYKTAHHQWDVSRHSKHLTDRCVLCSRMSLYSKSLFRG